MNAWFTQKQLTHIAAHTGGSKNLQAVKDCFEELRALDFTAASIEKMVAHIGGSKNLYFIKAQSASLFLLTPTTSEQIANQLNQSSKKRAREELTQKIMGIHHELLTIIADEIEEENNSLRQKKHLAIAPPAPINAAEIHSIFNNKAEESNLPRHAEQSRDVNLVNQNLYPKKAKQISFFTPMTSENIKNVSTEHLDEAHLRQESTPNFFFYSPE